MVCRQITNLGKFSFFVLMGVHAKMGHRPCITQFIYGLLFVGIEFMIIIIPL